MRKFIALVTLVMSTTTAMAAPSGPVMRLFPTTVLEDIKETGEVAAALESNLTDVIARLDLQQQLYSDSRCDGAEGDAGCARIADELGKTYLELLNTMSERLPAMEAAVNNTRDGLQKRLHQELGQKTTPSSLQDSLLGRESASSESRAALALRGRSGIRLSDRFAQYYKLVATRHTASSQSLAVIASDIYLDMEDASNLIAATRNEINRATLLEQLNQSLGQITPEMNEVVTGVKSILFGDGDAAPIAALPDPRETAFVSPLEI